MSLSVDSFRVNLGYCHLPSHNHEPLSATELWGDHSHPQIRNKSDRWTGFNTEDRSHPKPKLPFSGDILTVFM